ncbi:MAG: hypothetical protein ACK47B_22955 [Armatimonadota bacterium]
MKVVPTVLLLLALGAAPVQQVACSQGAAPPPRAAARPPGEGAPLFADLGDLKHPVTTRSAQAQRYFDQGLILMYGFNHKEAIRSFREAARLDPSCAMAYWGMAIARGPNINQPMPDEHVADAWNDLQKARERMPRASERERAYIEALSKRYRPEPVADRSALDRAYAEAMREVARRYPEDLDASVLFAEAVMDTMPWDYWTPDKKPKPETAEILTVLERVRAVDPRHPGANHFYIHAVEAGPDPKRALPAADLLLDFAPGAGHLVHMPAHIYLRVGLYHEASLANERAIKADESYLAQCRAQGYYPLVYYPHNQHFFSYSTMMEGRSADCLRHTRELASRVTPAHVEAGRLHPMVLFALVRFNRWNDVLKEPQPEPRDLFLRGISHYARGLARVGLGQRPEAEREAARLAQIVDGDAAKALEQPGFFGYTQLRIAHGILDGELAGMRGQHDERVRQLTQAVELQDRLPYMEPPYWYYPVRHSLGAALLESGRAAEAEAVYRQDLKENPANGWSLFGLEQSLRAQGKNEAADEVRQAFDQAWLRSDVKLRSSARVAP